MDLRGLSDSELMASMLAVCADSRRLLAKLLLHLNEVEERRLELRAAYPSIYEFCRQKLKMSEGEACRRIAAARLVKRFPSLLARIESGALNLTTLGLLKEHLSEFNIESLADAASGKTKREVEELVARLAPKPDVATTITEVPTPARVIPGASCRRFRPRRRRSRRCRKTATRFVSQRTARCATRSSARKTYSAIDIPTVT